MKKVKLYILQTIWFISAVIEFLWSVVCAIMGAIGEKMNELTDVLEISIEKHKS